MRFKLLAAVAAVFTFAAMAPCARADDSSVAFAYQGRVRVQGQPFNGTGQFKFAIVNTSASAVLWTHDGTGDLNDGPGSSVALNVEDGIFSAIVGDTTVTPNPINATIFNSPTPLKLRVWFNDGVRGFQKLNPDHNLVNLTLNVLQTTQQDFTIYVNGATGNDGNNGLTPTTAKKTIQAAVDTLPDRVRCNVTIDVADGVYRETVTMFGLAAEPGKRVTILGDESWTRASAGDPTVRITGANSAAPTTRVRNYGVVAVQCSDLTLKGLHIDYTIGSGVRFFTGLYIIENCKLSNNNIGLVVADASVGCVQVAVSNSTGDGIVLTGNASGSINACSSVNNGASGLLLNGSCTANLQGAGNYSDNTLHGIQVIHHSSIIFNGSAPNPNTATVYGNNANGLVVNWQSYSENNSSNVWGTGGNVNTSGNVYTANGSGNY